MKVKCITNRFDYINRWEIFDVVGQTDLSYIVETRNHGKQYYPKDCFEIVETLEDKLKAAEQEVERIKKLIEDSKPNVGDKYKHDNGDVYLLCSQTGGNTTFALNKIEGERGLGLSWAFRSNSIDDVFGGEKHKFTKIN